MTVENYTQEDIEEAFKADLEVLGNYFSYNWNFKNWFSEVGGKNEKGFTMDECFQAYQTLKLKLKDKKKKAAWKAAMEGQNWAVNKASKFNKLKSGSFVQIHFFILKLVVCNWTHILK